MNDVIHSPESIGNMIHGNQLGPFGEKSVVCLQIEGAVIKDGDDFESYSQSFTKHLPRNRVGVVLQSGNNDLISLLKLIRATEGGGDQIDGISGAGSEDDLLGAIYIEMLCDGLPGGFVGGSGRLGKPVNTTVDIGVDSLVVVPGRVENAKRFLGGGGVIEIDERFPVDLLIQDGKLLAKLIGIQSSHKGSVMPRRRSRKRCA